MSYSPSRPVPIAGPSRPPPDASRTPCRYYNSGYCWRGDACWFSHADPSPFEAGSKRHPLPSRPSDGQGVRAALKDSAEDLPGSSVGRLNARQLARQRDQAKEAPSGVKAEATDTKVPDEAADHERAEDKTPEASTSGSHDPAVAGDAGSDQEMCCICFETPKLYGLLENCSHVFCLPCIRNWRATNGKVPDQIASGVLRRCPACRIESGFTLASRHYYSGGPQKASLVAAMKRKWANIPCKNLERYGDCAFGYECFYKHADRRGNPIILGHSHSEFLLAREAERDLREVRMSGFAPHVLANMLGLERGEEPDDRIGQLIDSIVRGRSRRARRSGIRRYADDDDEYVVDDDEVARLRREARNASARLYGTHLADFDGYGPGDLVSDDDFVDHDYEDHQEDEDHWEDYVPARYTSQQSDVRHPDSGPVEVPAAEPEMSIAGFAPASALRAGNSNRGSAVMDGYEGVLDLSALFNEAQHAESLASSTTAATDAATSDIFAQTQHALRLERLGQRERRRVMEEEYGIPFPDTDDEADWVDEDEEDFDDEDEEGFDDVQEHYPEADDYRYGIEASHNDPLGVD